MAPINLPDGSQVSEIVLPDGSTASEVLAPDGSTVFSAIPDKGLLHEWDARQLNLNDQDSVSTWADQEGSADLSAQGSPTYETDVFGSEPGIYLDGSGDWFLNTSISESQPLAVFAVIAPVDPGSNSVVYAGSNRHFLRLRYSDSDHYYDFGSVTTGATAATGAQILTQLADGTSSALRRDNSQILSGGGGTNGLSEIGVGADPGYTTQGSKLIEGHLAHYLIYDLSQMDSGQVSEVEDYLNGIWGVY